MRESYLHYVWEAGLFEQKQLKSVDRDEVCIVQRGTLNCDSGPDFFNAQIRINGQLWVGNVEIHIRSSDWYKHNHQHDPAYDNTILHVVHEHDQPVFLKNGEILPCIELKHRVHDGMYLKYLQLTSISASIPCHFHRLQQYPKEQAHMYKRSLNLRLDQKANFIDQLLIDQGYDWNQCFFILLSRYFGFNVNAEPMEMLARITPLNILSRNRGIPNRVEALLFGQAGLLQPGLNEPYALLLKNEYAFLRRKYQLEPMNPVHWKLHRMRPQNFPTFRIAQLAATVNEEPMLFSKVISASSMNEIRDIFNCRPHKFWCTHFHFGKVSPMHSNTLGEDAVHHLITNVVVPFMFAHGRHTGNTGMMDNAIEFLKSMPAENNKITRSYVSVGFENQTAYTSQAILGLSNQFCSEKKCLQCSIGLRIISN